MAINLIKAHCADKDALTRLPVPWRRGQCQPRRTAGRAAAITTGGGASEQVSTE